MSTDTDNTRREALRAMLDADEGWDLDGHHYGWETVDDLPDGAEDKPGRWALVIGDDDERIVEWHDTLRSAEASAHANVTAESRRWWPEHLYDVDEQVRYTIAVEVSAVEVVA